MRVIAGTARRLQLKTPAGKHTRPTSDKIRETLFNILQAEIIGCCFCDLFSGSGGIAIEALSRGAREAVFVENDAEAVRCIRANLEHTHFEDVSEVMAMDVRHALRRMDRMGRQFDIIFMDPPYRMGWEERIVPYLFRSRLVHEDTLIVVEAPLEGEFLPGQDTGGWRVDRVKTYKTNRHIFLRYGK